MLPIFSLATIVLWPPVAIPALYKDILWTVFLLVIIVLGGLPEIVSWLQSNKQLWLFGLLVAVVIHFCVSVIFHFSDPFGKVAFANGLLLALSVIFLNRRPPIIVDLVNRPSGRWLLGCGKMLAIVLPAFVSIYGVDCINQQPVLLSVSSGTSSVTVLVLSLGSLQSPVNSCFARLFDVAFILLFSVFFLVKFSNFASGPIISTGTAVGLVLLFIGNLQIPAAVARIVLPSLRLFNPVKTDYQHPDDANLVESLVVFYALMISQGGIYLLACICGLFSFVPRRGLVHLCSFKGKWGKKCVDLYYDHAYDKCLEGSVIKPEEMDLVSFAIESLNSSSREKRLAGLRILHGFLRYREGMPDSGSSESEVASKVIASEKAVPRLIGMLGWTIKADEETRLFASKVVAVLAGRIRVAGIPGAVQLISSLLDAQDQPIMQAAIALERARERDGSCWAHWFSIPEEEPSANQDLLPEIGMKILGRLTYDIHNCAEISKATDLISKIIGYTNLTAHQDQGILLAQSLNLVKILASTGGKAGIDIRRNISDNPLLVVNLADVLDDTGSPELRRPAIEIIAKLCMDEGKRQEIGSIHMIIPTLMDAFLNKHESTGMVAGEALAMLAKENAENCASILGQQGNKNIKGIAKMLEDDEYIYVSATLLNNMCASNGDGLRRRPDSSELAKALLPAVSLLPKLLISMLILCFSFSFHK